MRKKLINVLKLTICLIIAFGFLYQDSFVYAEEKNNPDSLWSTENAPLFYGATKITLSKNAVDKFDVKDTRFRIFARDFEDGDLIPYITAQGQEDVYTDVPGSYVVTYSVTDSHGNESTIDVPIIVEDNEENKIKVERTIFTLPNHEHTQILRGMQQEWQTLGIFLPREKSFTARLVSGDKQLWIRMFTDDERKDQRIDIPLGKTPVTIKNTKTRDITDYDLDQNLSNFPSVPVCNTVILGKGDKDLTKTYVIEIEYNAADVPELDYYHYKDDEEKFKEDWKASQNYYGIIENEVMTVLSPLSDLTGTVDANNKPIKPRLPGAPEQDFSTLDKALEYYKKVVDTMDAYVGLEFNPVELENQNVRGRYFIRPDINSLSYFAAAYYSEGFIGIATMSSSAIWGMEWAGLHEIAHGYQGVFGTGSMALNEVGNNILAYYIETDKEIYTKDKYWLGKYGKIGNSIEEIEDYENEERLDGKTFLDVDVDKRLYMIVNLFDTFEGGKTYAKMFQWYRKAVADGTLADKDAKWRNDDIYCRAIADIYHVNIIPYMEAWGLPISESAKAEVNQKNYPALNIIKDMVSDESVNNILAGENTGRKYGLITSDVLEKYGITGNVTVNITMDDFDKLKGRTIRLKDGERTVKSAVVDSEQVVMEDVPVGTYYLQMPVFDDYNHDYFYVQVLEGKDNVYSYEYIKLADIDYNNYLTFKVRGNYETYGYTITFSENYRKATISFGGANIGYEDVYVKIMNAEGEVVSDERVVALTNPKGCFFEKYNQKESEEVVLEPGYMMEIKHPIAKDRVRVVHTKTGESVTEYVPTETVTTYEIMENGIKKVNMSDEEMEEISYKTLKPYLIELITKYKNEATDEELDNRYINCIKKSEVLNAYYRLREADRSEFDELIVRIQRGGIPIVSAVGNAEYHVGDTIDLYSLISVSDNEDEDISATQENTTITTELDTDIAGTYEVSYVVQDSDHNNSEPLVLNVNILDDEEEPGPGPDPNLENRIRRADRSG